MDRHDLAAVAAETLRILRDRSYRAPSGRRVDLAADLAAAVAGTRLHLPYELALEVAGIAGEPAAGVATRIEVSDESTLAASRRLATTEGDGEPAALNFASARHPGGGFLTGASAQEESLARSSGLYACLQAVPSFYQHHLEHPDPLHTDRVVYSPGVPVFRDGDGVLLERPYRVGMLTAAAPNAGALLRREPERRAEVHEALRARAAKVLAAAHGHGHRVLVLGAWGCGVFGNDPGEVAGAFAEHLLGGAFTGRFSLVLFAVLDPSPDRRVQRAFARRFG